MDFKTLLVNKIEFMMSVLGHLEQKFGRENNANKNKRNNNWKNISSAV
jgi:hypothetical protein